MGLLRLKQPFLWVYGLQWYPTPESIEQHPSCFIMDDWDITRDMKPEDVKAYLKDNGMKFNYRNTKGYLRNDSERIAREVNAGRITSEMAEIVTGMGTLVFKKPKNEIEILRITIFTSFYLESGVQIGFVDGKHVNIFKHDFDAR